MLYLDSSALIKRYQNEQGTETLNIRLREEAKGFRSEFTSVLTYTEIHAAFARRTREKLQWPIPSAKSFVFRSAVIATMRLSTLPRAPLHHAQLP